MCQWAKLFSEEYMFDWCRYVSICSSIVMKADWRQNRCYDLLSFPEDNIRLCVVASVA